MDALAKKISSELVETWKNKERFTFEMACLLFDIADEVKKSAESVDKRLADAVEIFDDVLKKCPFEGVPDFFKEVQSEVAKAFVLLFFLSEKDFEEVCCVYDDFLKASDHSLEDNVRQGIYLHASYILEKTKKKQFFSTDNLLSILTFAAAVGRYYKESLGEKRAGFLAFRILKQVIKRKTKIRCKNFFEDLFAAFLALQLAME